MAGGSRNRAGKPPPRLRPHHAEKQSHGNERREEEVVTVQSCWAPSFHTAFKVLLSARFCAALLSNISDCDETYNYWEPTHYLMYGKGFQTWEYSPAYGLRSYAYVWLHILPALFHSRLLKANKVLIFYFIRCVLGFFCALAEAYFYKGICKKFGAHVGRMTLCFLLFSTGMFISSTAFLPSSFSMIWTMVAMAAWWTHYDGVAIFSIAVSAIVGWPFAAALGIPIAVDLVLRRQRVALFCQWVIISLCLVLVPLMMVDTVYYGKLVVAPLNIVLYNVFSDHGPDIYGVEPWTFYFLNGFLNFNIVFLMGLVAMPLGLFVDNMLKQRSPGYVPTHQLMYTLSPLYIWVIIFFTRPHKEERFLFPVYPLICLCAAVTLASFQKLYHFTLTERKRQHYTIASNWVAVGISVLYGLLCVSRSVALFQGYHAPLDLYPELSRIVEDPSVHTMDPSREVNLCVGKEWYRFPNSFFLPENWQLQFIQSEFRGQLPKPYAPGADGSKVVPTHMNDMNLEETSRYIDLRKCHYLVDLDLPGETQREPRYARLTKDWTVVASQPFLDSARSHPFFRAFFIPFLSKHHTEFTDYNILQNTRLLGNKRRTEANQQ
ncbi:PREDICTED: alpha-1,2-mannosyltransferase ALG9-like isoform X2 [Branchiostoma belcheri]|uniref:Mannosyltransferase n=1 Tax=Branchiostoma belcheri TaxID=7741 RepID=A0A6P4YNV7_BRABE|nr:PREDICTED: alpha-1,2-mannosyltransferase ALG9-like isoform X2 [Branchiostoma belcheri]